MNYLRSGIEAIPRVSVSVAAQGTISTVAGQAIGANAVRKRLMIQNTGATILRLVFGSGTPTQTVYHVALTACTLSDDGTGGIYFDDAWTGAVQIISSAPGGTYVLTEIS